VSIEVGILLLAEPKKQLGYLIKETKIEAKIVIIINKPTQKIIPPAKQCSAKYLLSTGING
jgi:hypothetical protein